MTGSHIFARWLLSAMICLSGLGAFAFLAAPTPAAGPPPAPTIEGLAAEIRLLEAELKHKQAEVDVSRRKLAGARERMRQLVQAAQWREELRRALSESPIVPGRSDRKGIRKAVAELEDVIRKDPTSVRATRARLQLANACDQLASRANERFLLEDHRSENRAHLQKERRRWLRRAAEEYTQLERVLNSPQSKKHLGADVRQVASFRGAKRWFELGEYDKALGVYSKWTSGDISADVRIDALGGCVSCHAAPGRIDRVRESLLCIDRLLPLVSPETRRVWEPWLQECGKAFASLDR